VGLNCTLLDTVYRGVRNPAERLLKWLRSYIRTSLDLRVNKFYVILVLFMRVIYNYSVESACHVCSVCFNSPESEVSDCLAFLLPLLPDKAYQSHVDMR
jgi:hypothetical protein